MMRFLVVSKGSGQGAGESQAARYVARRKNDDERKSEEPTKLFSAQAENLGDKRANLWLGDGHVPQTRDVQHLVLSFAHEYDFLTLGDDETARQQALRELTSALLGEVAERLDAQELRWVAGIHRNTDNPHVHLLLQRAYVDRAGRSQRLSAKRPEWHSPREKNGQGERVAQPSPMSQIFARLWEERAAQKAAKFIPSAERRLPDELTTKSQNERGILGRALLAQAGLEVLERLRADLHKFSEHRRYAIVNEAGQRVRLSAHDLAQQARLHARQLIAALPFALPSPEREGLQARLQAQWLAERTSTLDQLAEAQAKDAKKLAARQTKFQQQAEPILAAAQAIQQQYEKEGKPAPLPLLSPTALTYLQEQAIQFGDGLRLTSLEQLRRQLGDEKYAEPRSEKEIERLIAQQILAEARWQTERKLAAEFAANQHLYRWEIPAGYATESEPRKASLASVERALRFVSDQAKFIGARAIHWDDKRRGEAQTRVAELTEQRALILQKIAERQNEFAGHLERQGAVVNALHEIVGSEKEQRKLTRQTWPVPQFNAVQLRELEWLAARRADPEFTRTWQQWERDFAAQSFTQNDSFLAERTSRALARVILAEIAQHEATSQLKIFVEKRERTTVLLKESGAPEPTSARLVEVAPRARLERAFPSLFANYTLHQAVAAALVAQEKRLMEERHQAAQNRILLTASARAYIDEFRQVFPHQALPPPTFHPQEIERLAGYLERENDHALREHYQVVYQQVAGEAGGRRPELNEREHVYEAFNPMER